METLTTEVLVVGGGTGGSAAAIQAARRGAQTILVSEFGWLGGMLTAAGVSAPDGNELAAFQTGLWGDFLRQLRRRQPGGLHHGWVSFTTYEPAVGAAIFADWVKALPNLKWLAGHRPRAMLRQGDRVVGVRFDQLTIQAQMTVDGTELGDLLALGAVSYRWGWEPRSRWQEPSAPVSLDDPADPLYALTQRYPVQSPTWVAVMQDYGAAAPMIPAARTPEDRFAGAWDGYGPERFLNYGRLPGDRFMLNWPQQGNDYGVGLTRLVESEAARRDYGRAAIAHSQSFARYIQTQLGQRYGLASTAFPSSPDGLGGGAFALMPYYRESRRVQGLTTVREQDILPMAGGQVAALPVNAQGQVSAIAIGNYANDHHYPGFDLPLTPKSLRWGGRWTGTPFTIPYEALIPAEVDGLLVCEKNISVSHIANGATRLQPVVLGIGQAAGMAAALCLEQACQPRQLPVRQLQLALLRDSSAPAAIVPLFDLRLEQPQWQAQQIIYLDNPDRYPLTGHCELSSDLPSLEPAVGNFTGTFHAAGHQSYRFVPSAAAEIPPQGCGLVTLEPSVDRAFQALTAAQPVKLHGHWNPSGEWLVVSHIDGFSA
ncbi:FAD-dependent oxidoreductase [Romeria aff. gracilis LEGE 07310]|uniref:FAD-dependent oxidoreductase n=1 Tax=Vasconcelosia minhoensis LEGE 07310 TaxID=915328 RepID=A0A8J7AYA5_9CYAN|nr:FAD-dependent oxidoreductase [Romeria gracilis]MBE9078447.1 FAD-dependent oxidoreductase [Romeria aff. gracilis LEGE 07310]